MPNNRPQYVPPSRCELCITSTRLITDGYYLTITETEHEHGCPNHPQHQAQIPGHQPNERTAA